ncbi:tetratricopeptide repeat protein [Phreatobacter stygius]|uniref:Tetratricopeptide repeat protein 38 n=1 Tax=Phreatobacter stygius TaxID=1940610 RepID=A0A4D7B4E0_9HYPH|nr:tetratricopeptide repeat protein [Phreatobacter stygius]QCI67801.1 tetratricopeptide repeat protein [Phreatobacter stygius]
MTCASDAAAVAFDHAVAGYLTYRLDTAARVKACLAVDPDFCLAHVLRGYLTLAAFNLATVPAAREALALAKTAAVNATAREQAHVAALEAWVDGRLDELLARWEAIVARHPTDVLAFRLHHFNAFWLGRPEQMLAVVEATLPHWELGLAGRGAVLACRAFANEECGNYTVAENSGREAIALDPGDIWATHAVAHVMEMQGRRSEGILLLRDLEPHWQGGNNLKHHLWWHRGLYHLEREEFDEVLALYDKGFRNLGSPIVEMQPDLYIDVQNAASMLFRLQLQGVDVGDRWIELADKAEGRIGDCLNAFTLPHWMMALVHTGRYQAAEAFLAGLEAAAAGSDTIAGLVRLYALPISAAVLAHGRGRYQEAVELMRPALGGMYRLGGSHAQQDVLEQLFTDAAAKAGSKSDVLMMLERIAGRYPVPPENRIGYRHSATLVA